MAGDVELRDLRIFLVLAEELHFGRTAERLSISQSAVSESVRGLESQLEAKLFERTSRRVRLTLVGEQLHQRISPLIGALEQALVDTRDLSGRVAGLLRVGFVLTTDGPPLTELIAAFETRYPACEVCLREVETFDAYRSLRQGDVDALCNWLAVDEPDLTAGSAFAFYERALAVAPTHPLAGRSAVSVEDLANEEVAQPPPTIPEAVWDLIVPPFAPSGRPIRRTTPVRTIHEILSFVARGLIVHPTSSNVPLFDRGDIVLVPIVDLAPLPLGMVWCTKRENARIRALNDMARSMTAP